MLVALDGVILTDNPVTSTGDVDVVEKVSVFVVLTTCNTQPAGNAALATPVQLVRTPDAGVPKAGVTRVGEVPNTLAPLPVLVVTPVPPLATGSVPVNCVTAMLLFVSVSVVALPTRVSVATGSVKTPDPATRGAVMEILPDVSPATEIELKIVLLYFYNYQNAKTSCH